MGRDPSPPAHPPLAENDVVKMRSRIADMGLSSVPSLTPKEQELGGMVRLFPWPGRAGVIHICRAGHPITGRFYRPVSTAPSGRVYHLARIAT